LFSGYPSVKPVGLSKKERIKRRKEFQLVYSSGKTVISPQNKFKATIYFIENESHPFVKVAFAVHKKAGNAVWRNRVKRLLRESYRLNKIDILNQSVQRKKSVYIIFSPRTVNKKNYKTIILKQVMPEVVGLLNKIKNLL